MATRREFIKYGSYGLCGLAAARLADAAPAEENLVEARYYEKLPDRKIKCLLCPRECVIDDLERGYCGARENIIGAYYTLVYGKVVSAHVDPIEKKPLFHVLPSSTAFSLATTGCNVFCKFCQNWEISQARPEQVPFTEISPERAAEIARSRSCPIIAYTYNEPIIFTEFMYDIARAAAAKGVRSVMISNGYIQTKPLLDLCKVLHAVKIDLKAFTERFYKELVSGQLRPVLDTLVTLRREHIWTEIVYLVIPGQNDDRNELVALCHWIRQELDADVPLHFTRFYPQYRLANLPPTPIATLNMARNIGLDSGLHFVYTGNIPGDPGENTYCPGCQTVLIRRFGFSILENKIKNKRCPQCNTVMAGIWS